MVLPYVAAGEVTTLKHELGDDTVEAGALVVEGLAGAASALLAGAESAAKSSMTMRPAGAPPMVMSK